MARRRYRYTWDQVAWMDCDWMSGWDDGGAFNGFSGSSETSGETITTHMEHDQERDIFSVFYVPEDQEPVRSNIRLIRKAQGFGGGRVHFIAPCCGKVCRKLALLPSGVVCGACGSITQPTTRKGKTQRLVHKADVLAGRLKCENWYSEPKERPKHMKRDTFLRLRDEHARAVQAAMRVIEPRLIRAMRRGPGAAASAMLRAGM